MVNEAGDGANEKTEERTASTKMRQGSVMNQNACRRVIGGASGHPTTRGKQAADDATTRGGRMTKASDESGRRMTGWRRSLK